MAGKTMLQGVSSILGSLEPHTKNDETEYDLFGLRCTKHVLLFFLFCRFS